MILTGFQLRAARKALKLHLEQLYQSTEVSKVTLMRLEKSTSNLENINCTTKDAQNLYDYFIQNNLLFTNKDTISLNITIEQRPIESNLTRFQFIVARTALRLTQKALGEAINIPESVITEYERKVNNEYIISKYLYLDKFIDFFQKQGVTFHTNLSVKTLR